MPTVPPGMMAAIVLVGGSGTRIGAGRNTVYLPLADRAVPHLIVAHAHVALFGVVPPVVSADRDMCQRRARG